MKLLLIIIIIIIINEIQLFNVHGILIYDDS